MTDFKKLLENGCLVETHIKYTDHLNDNEYAVLSILTTHPEENDSDNFDISSSYYVDMETVVLSTLLNEAEVLEALNCLEEKGYIEESKAPEKIIVYLKAFDCNSKPQ